MKKKFKHGESGREVVKIGEFVHKTLGENYEFTHKILRHLENVGFKYSPRILGIDDKRREIMTYFDGSPIEADPIPLETSIQAIKILREFHDLLSKLEGVGVEQTICHLDYAPWNVLQNDDVIVGIIDFDDLHIGQRIDDVTYAIWTFLDLGDENTHFTSTEQINQIAILVKAYGTDIDLSECITSLIGNQERVLKMRMESVKNAVEDSDKEYQQGKVRVIQNSIDWVRRHKDSIESEISYL